MPGKVEDVCPHLRNVSNDAVVRVRMSARDKNSHLPNTAIVAIVSIDVTIREISTSVLGSLATKEFL